MTSPVAALDGLSPEAQVLFLAAGDPNPASDARIAQLLDGPFAWARFYWLMERERSAPMVRRRLGGIDGVAVPDEQQDHLRKLAMIAEFRANHLEHRLHEALDLLDRAGIASMVLKGAALAYTVYDGFAERPMGDIDLLILDPDQAHAAQDLLAPAGWRWSENSALADEYQEHHHLPPLSDEGGTGLRIEVHTGLFPPGHGFGEFEEAYKATRRQVRVRNRSLAVADTVHQLLHLSLHFAWSHYMQVGAWRALRDVATMARRGEPDWQAVLTEARRYSAAACCYWTLRLSRTVVGAPVPPDVLRALRPPAQAPFERWLERRFIHRLVSGETAFRSSRLDKALWSLGVRTLSEPSGKL